ncbi:hypothetical protein [Gordonia phthalatica]|uniref:Uncharacterized protein n=1 Tax=Gordonia phthalatica TaxID=1136941 RepID=A0A0N9N471_9ACTN|nr:hypothetical protein [Gordonia phthalatica]ALG85601.1 hypothetical protein ACH46_15350 [Gordonia phthalatica]
MYGPREAGAADADATQLGAAGGDVVGSPVTGVLEGLGVKSLPAPATVELPAGLPALPDLPALPVLPTIDPMMLLKPITDLLGVFGTGLLGGAPGGDPSATHQQIAGLLENGVGVLLNAASSLDGGWLGQAATAAITAATRTAGESGVVAAQGAGMSMDLQAAAAVVATGALQLQGVVVKTAGLLSAALPAIATPPGQIAALGIAAEGLAEGLAVVAATRAQLVAPTAHMAANGTPVPVTGVPGGDVFGTAATLLQSALPLVQAGAQLATSLLSGTGLPSNEPETRIGDQTSPAPGAAAPCPTTCEKSGAATSGTGTGATSTGAPKPGAGGPTVKAASAVSGGAPTTGGVPTAVGVSAPAPSPLADCPTTTNAVTASTSTVSAGGPQMTAAGTGTALPMAPVATAAARPTDVARTVPAVPATVSEQPDDAGRLSAMTAESFDFDVALALGLGDHDLAGSA